jgi:hypothetical protein
MQDFLNLCLQYELDVPIEVKVGTIGRINLSIPWTGLYTQSVIVTVEVRQNKTHILINMAGNMQL